MVLRITCSVSVISSTSYSSRPLFKTYAVYENTNRVQVIVNKKWYTKLVIYINSYYDTDVHVVASHSKPFTETILAENYNAI